MTDRAREIAPAAQPKPSYRKALRLSHLWKDDWTYKWDGEVPAELHQLTLGRSLVIPLE
jgi:hypothetical protein